nr:immunoglobulin light chain junction region [Macaca mulatta]MOV79083.1 immunoglobulin light chain junction region [Macaca mulatta]MOV82743.1 immunoglobulin light chain junction region [Macaca mulatta]MOX55016.1 immunoglobulin light chain junction region [Macaca mulatta]
CMQGIEYPYSF